VKRASDLQQLLEFEGAGTRAHYAALRAAVARNLDFPRRTRRPP